ncbi:MAG: sulfite exporter TauE/SafE family protein [Planctomycetales bacterium]|nr:sulfite exporter TauE/SafE family protein [Planctomycetales bacterium]
MPIFDFTSIPLATLLIVGVVLMLASVLQSTVGFAAGLFGIPLLTLAAGLTLPEAVMTMLLASILQNAGGVLHLRSEFRLGDSLGPLVIRLAAIPPGIVALRWATDLPQQTVKAMLGVVLLALVLLQIFFAPRQPVTLRPIWMWIAFIASGFFVGFVGMGGPPMVLWVMAQPWSSQRSRAFLFLMFLSSLVPHVVLLHWMLGDQVDRALPLALAGVPWIVVGTVVGLRLGALLPKEKLRAIAYAILVVTALSAMAAPLVPHEEVGADELVAPADSDNGVAP